MKTVMKKIFSLLLVAVMLVSAVPFAAFAAEEKTTAYDLSLEPGTYSVDALLTAQGYTGSSTNYWVHCHAPAEDYVAGASFEAVADRAYTLYVVDTVADAVPATVTCSNCGETYTEGTTHTCPTLTCDKCGDSYTKGTTHTCPPVLCNTCGDYYTKGTTHTCPTCTAISGCVLSKNHSGEHKCACGLYPQKGTTHNATCPFYESTTVVNPNNNYSLKVWAKLWVGESLNKTILLDEFTGLNGTEVVPYIIGNNISRLESKFPSGYTNIEWTKAVYYYIDSNTTGTVDTNMNVNEEDNVYINLYSQEKLVVVRVHTAKTYAISSSVQVGGFRVGETVTYDDVLKAVKKFYDVSSMTMYTYDNWCKVVEGKDYSTTPYFSVHGGDNVYEVYVSGSPKASTGTSSSTADSSNPKTGDMIFAPVAVMGLSVSALAVLFFLNKKRAF